MKSQLQLRFSISKVDKTNLIYALSSSGRSGQCAYQAEQFALRNSVFSQEMHLITLFP